MNNILFFLTPKAMCSYLYDDYTMRQALEKMEHYKYSAIPILNNEGEYVGTITEGDILWHSRHNDMAALKWPEDLHLLDIPRRNDYATVNASSNMEDLLSKALRQNFVPVVDDCGKFIGIITRSDIIQYYYNKM